MAKQKTLGPARSPPTPDNFLPTKAKLLYSPEADEGVVEDDVMAQGVVAVGWMGVERTASHSSKWKISEG